MNTIYVAGNLGGDPVSRFTPGGQKVTTFNIATNVKKGENTITIWYKITIWGDRFDKMMPYVKKGSSLIVIGELQKPEIWTDKEGRPQITLEVWAEILRFSPFGRSDKEQTGGTGASRNSPYGAGSNDEGFGEQTFGGGSQRGSQQGQRQPQQMEEDPLPF